MRRFFIRTLILLGLAVVVFGPGAYFGYELFIKPKEALKQEAAQGPMQAPPDQSIPEFQRCLALKNQHKLVEARTAFETFVQNYPASTKLQEAKDALGEINVEIFLSGVPAPEKEAYTIQKGDVLAKIEKKLKVPGEMIMRSNNIDDPRRLHIGDVLYISHPQFSILISRKDQTVTLYNHGKFFKRYHARQWNVPPTKNNAPITTKVTDVAGFRNGQRVAYGTKEYLGSAHWVQMANPNYTLYTDPAEGGEKAAAGIVLSAEEMEELSALLKRGVPVTIE